MLHRDIHEGVCPQCGPHMPNNCVNLLNNYNGSSSGQLRTSAFLWRRGGADHLFLRSSRVHHHLSQSNICPPATITSSHPYVVSSLDLNPQQCPHITYLTSPERAAMCERATFRIKAKRFFLFLVCLTCLFVHTFRLFVDFDYLFIWICLFSSFFCSLCLFGYFGSFFGHFLVPIFFGQNVTLLFLLLFASLN